jgi:aminoglycoside phosphotransferase (APT) family kinase protein
MEKGELIGCGRTADVFAWGNGQVLKLYQDWMPRAPIEREFAITRTAHQAGLPVPAVEEVVQIDGRTGIVLERIEGISMLKALELRPWKLAPIARQLAELHARMHTCELPGDTYTQRQQIERGIGFSNALSEEDKRATLALLADLPNGNAVCHGDYHPDNVILTAKGPVIIDWMTGTRGHPTGDVARTALLFKTGGMPPGIPFHMRVLINSVRSLLFSTYLNRYLELHPASHAQIDAWMLPLLAARLFEVEEYPLEKQLILKRIASINQRMAKRRSET